MSLFPVVIHHNPACGTSRNVLAMIQAAGHEPDVISYLENGWTRPQLLALFAAVGLTPRAALRDTKSPAQELGLLEPGVTDAQILDAMLVHPVLVNRPIVATPKGVRLCRPSELVLACWTGNPRGRSGRKTGPRSPSRHLRFA